jgi:hypothetical protein
MLHGLIQDRSRLFQETVGLTKGLQQPFDLLSQRLIARALLSEEGDTRVRRMQVESQQEKVFLTVR